MIHLYFDVQLVASMDAPDMDSVSSKTASISAHVRMVGQELTVPQPLNCLAATTKITTKVIQLQLNESRQFVWLLTTLCARVTFQLFSNNSAISEFVSKVYSVLINVTQLRSLLNFFYYRKNNCTLTSIVTEHMRLFQVSTFISKGNIQPTKLARYWKIQ